jgi:hypothetical protein
MNPDFDMSNGAIQEDWLRTLGIDNGDAAEEDPARESTTRPHVTGNSRLSLAIRTKTPPQSPVLIDCANSPADCAAPFSNSPHNGVHP